MATYGEIERLNRLAWDVAAHVPAVALVEERLGRELVDVLAELGFGLAVDVKRRDLVVAHVLDELAHPLGLHLDGGRTIRVCRRTMRSVQEEQVGEFLQKKKRATKAGKKSGVNIIWLIDADRMPRLTAVLRPLSELQPCDHLSVSGRPCFPRMSICLNPPVCVSKPVARMIWSSSISRPLLSLTPVSVISLMPSSPPRLIEIISTLSWFITS